MSRRIGKWGHETFRSMMSIQTYQRDILHHECVCSREVCVHHCPQRVVSCPLQELEGQVMLGRQLYRSRSRILTYAYEDCMKHPYVYIVVDNGD